MFKNLKLTMQNTLVAFLIKCLLQLPVLIPKLDAGFPDRRTKAPWNFNNSVLKAEGVRVEQPTWKRLSVSITCNQNQCMICSSSLFHDRNELFYDNKVVCRNIHVRKNASIFQWDVVSITFLYLTF